MSIDTAKAERYRYFFCTSQKRQRNRAPTGCRESHMHLTDRVEIELDRIYQRIQLPADIVARVEDQLHAEIATRQRRAPSRNATGTPHAWQRSTPNATSCSTLTTPTPSPSTY
jgi:hypothetical protein